MTWAFSDESERGSSMLLGVVFVPTGAVASIRRDLRGLLLPGQRRVHTAKESPRRRRVMLDLVASLEVEAVVLLHRRKAGTHRVEARHDLVVAATRLVTDHGVSTWVLDDQEPVQSARDRHSIATVAGPMAPLVYDHRPSRLEPLLWAADALVWATGAGGEWRRRIDHLVATQAVP